MPPNPNKLIPYMSEEEQDVSELEPVVFGAGAYASPDPASSENTLLPLTDDPMVIGGQGGGETASEVPTDEEGNPDYGAMLKADLLALAEGRGIEGASDMTKDELVVALEESDAS